MSTPRRVLTRPCPAKVNLALSVGPPDPQTRYHPIASWMVALDWGDTLTLAALTGDEAHAARGDDALSLDIRFAGDAPQPQAVDWPLEKDLAWRAHRLLQEHVGRALPARASLLKRIPAGAGLGGGSSDAAAMLLALNELFSLRLGADELARLSMHLGSDVAFLVRAAGGEPSGVVTGFGDVFAGAPLRMPLHVVLFLPNARCATPAVYRAFDDLGAAELDAERIRDLAAADPLDASVLLNDLFEPALRVAPVLRDVHARLRDALDAPVHLTGSGAAMFAIATSPEHARSLAATATRVCGIPAVATTTRTP